MKKTHFVYPYIIPKNPAFGWELQFSIRSLYKNFKGDFDITVIGEIPRWLDTTKVLAIQFDNSNYGLRVQSRTAQKLLLAADIYDEIVFIHDDYYLIEPCTIEDFKTIRHLSTNLKYNPNSENNLTRFQKQIRYTYFRLKDLGKRYTYNYATHSPFYYESKKLKEIDRIFNLTSDGEYAPVVENAYYNYFNVDSIPIGNFRRGFWGPASNKTIPPEAKILNHDEKGFLNNTWILSWLNNKFPKKSPAELF